MVFLLYVHIHDYLDGLGTENSGYSGSSSVDFRSCLCIHDHSDGFAAENSVHSDGS